MIGTIAIADYDWYERLRETPDLEEVNFWKPSSKRSFRAEKFSPFLFKLRSPHRAICGFGFFERYSRLPDWLAWDCFGTANGCESLQEMRERITQIRERIRFKGDATDEIGCVLVVQPVFFPYDSWVKPPLDWPIRTQTEKKYNLIEGEGARVWSDCLVSAEGLRVEKESHLAYGVAETNAQLYGSPTVVVPRLGQGTFRIAVTEAYGRGCAVTDEHSLPALDAAHIKAFSAGGPHDICNGILLRVDIHRLFDRGYITVSPSLRLEVSRRLREDFDNGRSYYPLEGCRIRCPGSEKDKPMKEYLSWHNDNVYLG